ncbi:menaquinol-cytochrome c reductase iron-sulfur subunit precursor [Propioniferax innocua]|uniref:Cytochrome bc1 complex Rieske iron-sulfur subunit n=2 Tax=Propioniferax innocua TaxID=1753 RepID=A0A542ZR68_9ACTN|nr:menaquinol-cytochrome c reductase iron-sulfur subunit precursor [Propioniferax innocua]
MSQNNDMSGDKMTGGENRSTPVDANDRTAAELVAERESNGTLYEHPVPDPGLEEHIERYSDAEPKVGDDIAKQITGMFIAAPVLAIAFIVIYFAVPDVTEGGPMVDFGPIQTPAAHLGMGLTLGAAVLLIGLGAVQWARMLMNDEELIEERHPARSSEEDRKATMAEVDKGIADSGISRRGLMGRALGGAIGVVAVAPLVTLADLGPWPTPSRRAETIERTLFHLATPEKPVRLVNDVTYTPIKASDMEIGQLINAQPENLAELKGTEPAERPEELKKFSYMNEKSKSAIIIVRMDPNSIRVPERRSSWHVGGIMCYSKICTHVGCPISLWEQQTHHLLCPCHQSTFDLGDSGKVVFGPAARALPQLPITVDDEGYLIATSDFEIPVGPSYPERKQHIHDKGE